MPHNSGSLTLLPNTPQQLTPTVHKALYNGVREHGALLASLRALAVNALETGEAGEDTVENLLLGLGVAIRHNGQLADAVGELQPVR